MSDPSVRALQSLVGRLQVRLRHAAAELALERRRREQVERVFALYMQATGRAPEAAAPAEPGAVVGVQSVDAEPSSRA